WAAVAGQAPSGRVATSAAPPTTFAAPPGKEAAPPKKEVKAPEKFYKFTMSGKPWPDVFKWLTELTKKPLVSKSMPRGTCTINPPSGNEYTLAQVVDMINEALLSQEPTDRYYLLVRDHTLTLVGADEKIDEHLLPRITEDELDKYGNTQLVSMEMKLRTVN